MRKPNSCASDQQRLQIHHDLLEDVKRDVAQKHAAGCVHLDRACGRSSRDFGDDCHCRNHLVLCWCTVEGHVARAGQIVPWMMTLLPTFRAARTVSAKLIERRKMVPSL